MQELPIDSVLPDLKSTLARHRSAVLLAPPGAGKTTRVPLALLEESWLAGQRIIVLEPRRLAARAAALRLAEQLGEPVGRRVGYRIRFESKVSALTRIEVVTEGILTRRLQQDPELEGVGLVIFDEFHERHLESDLALALCRDAQVALRDDLRLLVMSATLDGGRVAEHLQAPLVASEGRCHPVEVHHLPRDPEGPIGETVARWVLTALAENSGDVLAFLPGVGEIRRAAAVLEEPLAGRAGLHPLYGDLPMEAQQRAILPDREGGRKVVLATNIAETSLTIEGVSVVVDSGWARVPRFDPGSGLTRLETVRISRASAEQRAGRAGRLGPGVCYRLWSEGTQRGLVPQTPPEILHADLAPLALELAAWGVHGPEDLSWMDLPPAGPFAQARALLTDLEALDEYGRITDTGRAMAGLPLHPRLGHMLLRARELGVTALGADIAALLSERDLLRERGRCDFGLRLQALEAFRRGGAGGARALGADPNGCRAVERAASQFRRLLGVREQARAGDEWAAILLAFAYPDRVAKRREQGSGRYLLSGGRGARLDSGCDLARGELLVASDLDGAGEESRIRVAAALDEELLREHLAPRILHGEEVAWDARSEAVIARRVERLGQVILRERRLHPPPPEPMAQAMLEGVRAMGLGALPWSEEARALQARVLSLRHWCPEEDWPDLGDAALGERLEKWLLPYLQGIGRREQLGRLDLAAILLAMLPWEQQRRLDEGAPTHLQVPSGARKRLRYTPGESPVLAVKLQEMFGLADTPRVAWGKVAVTLHLLSPAQRPIQVTQDLRGFWGRTYAEVKKELKGRYPKHPWPEDPWSAPATARTRRR